MLIAVWSTTLIKERKQCVWILSAQLCYEMVVPGLNCFCFYPLTCFFKYSTQHSPLMFVSVNAAWVCMQKYDKHKNVNDNGTNNNITKPLKLNGQQNIMKAFNTIKQ